MTLGSGEVVQAWFNLPAALIMVFITALLVVGIKESAGFNAAMVLLNVGVILAIIGVGAAYVDPANWRPFLHEEKGWRGVAEGAAPSSSPTSASTRSRRTRRRPATRSATWRSASSARS